MGTPSPDRRALGGPALLPASRCSARYFTDIFRIATATSRFGVLARRPRTQRASRNILVPHACSSLLSVTRTRRPNTRNIVFEVTALGALTSQFARVNTPSAVFFMSKCRWLKMRLWGRRDLCRLVRNARHGCRARGGQQGCCSSPVR